MRLFKILPSEYLLLVETVHFSLEKYFTICTSLMEGKEKKRKGRKTGRQAGRKEERKTGRQAGRKDERRKGRSEGRQEGRKE